MSASYYVNIPFRILEDKDLTASEKVLYGHISALVNKRGYCFASNKYFSKVSGNVSVRTVQRWIAKLEKKDFVRVHVVRNDDGLVIERRIYLYDNPLERDEKSGDLSRDGDVDVTRVRHECHDSGDVDVTYNTTVNNTVNSTEEGEPPPVTENDQSMDTPYSEIELYAIKAFEKVYGRVPSPREEMAFRAFVERNGEPSEHDIDEVVTMCSGRFGWMVDKLPRVMKSAKQPQRENEEEWIRLWNENKERQGV